MTDKEILDLGYCFYILPLAAHNNWGYVILKKKRLSWVTELNKFDFETPEEAREEGIKQLKFIINI